MSTITNCRACESPDLVGFFDLGPQPPANSLLKSPDEPEEYYPLALVFCENCSLVQIDETVDPKKLFSRYVWVTGTSKGANEFSEKFYEDLIKRTSNPQEGYVLELASNDGTFLKPFQKHGYQVLGIDPAENIVEMANAAGVPTKVAFWGSETAREIVKQKGQAKMIFARNVMAHVANTRDFVAGIREALRADGVVAIETHYGKRILEDLQYDSIYHEHLCCFTLKSLEKLLSDTGLYVFDVAAGPISGGALIVYASKTKREESGELIRFREEEAVQKTNELQSWENFKTRVLAHREKLLQILAEAKKMGPIIGWGASARSSTLLNFAKIGPNELPLIIDMNPLKQGLYTAGTHIPIKSDEIMKENPTLIFILGWNFEKEITASLREKFGFKGTCLVPLPGEPRLITLN